MLSGFALQVLRFTVCLSLSKLAAFNVSYRWLTAQRYYVHCPQTLYARLLCGVRHLYIRCWYTVPASASSWRQETGKPASRQPGSCGPRAYIEQATPFPGRVNQGSLFFECVDFSYVVIDLVCSAILPSNWLAGPCPNDACVEELVSTKTSCFRTR